MMNYITQTHLYTLASTGLGVRRVKTFLSREAANHYMYKQVAKHNLTIEEVWNDNHDKTYNCTNNVVFYIQRAR